tara:strand:- start:644 stop:1162 length:519 start_codon:yes stop_codon:yes gene_type:complete
MEAPSVVTVKMEESEGYAKASCAHFLEAIRHGMFDKEKVSALVAKKMEYSEEEDYLVWKDLFLEDLKNLLKEIQNISGETKIIILMGLCDAFRALQETTLDVACTMELLHTLEKCERKFHFKEWEVFGDRCIKLVCVEVGYPSPFKNQVFNKLLFLQKNNAAGIDAYNSAIR